ncbi:MAG: hypothetical protein M1834_007772 [Cirrosporium novae-zelandiae]|nr:MAG: hypothetical protein M1834_007772 [Cirrosporium novae-zelandiae]
MSITQVNAKAVFAHMIIGNCASMTESDWVNDITLAKSASIDGFALNIGDDDYTSTALQNAYSAAATVGGFSVFLSFDYAAYAWDASSVIETINTYKSLDAQYLVNGQPLVSTFEGTDNQDDWANIKTQTDCFFMPDWTSIGAVDSFPLTKVDGAMSWDAWPEGAEDKTTVSDIAWQAILGSKPYMMPVSPWFYTNLPAYGKNFLWRGDDLWHERWQQVVEVSPEFVEILTWNDFGESHYIGPIYETGIPSGSERYVSSMSHDAWREALPYYIAAYKSGNSTVPNVTEEKIVYWYRPNPASSGSTDGTVGNNPDYQPTLPPAELSLDKIFVNAIVSSPASVSVQIGSNTATTLKAMTSGVNHFSVPFNGQTGNVTITISRDGQTVATVEGAEISDSCDDGIINWNAITGSSS